MYGSMGSDNLCCLEGFSPYFDMISDNYAILLELLERIPARLIYVATAPGPYHECPCRAWLGRQLIVASHGIYVKARRSHRTIYTVHSWRQIHRISVGQLHP